MYELKKDGKVFTSKFVGTGPSSYEKRIYRAAVSQRLRNTVLWDYTKAAAYRIVKPEKKAAAGAEYSVFQEEMKSLMCLYVPATLL